jgi:hypothetical protein
MAHDSTLYSKAVQVTEEYLGPAGERFLRRQIEAHLNIKPENLQEKNLSKLINWSSIAFALLTNNEKDIAAFTNDLKALAQKGR